jgi:YD repeat-containing protein
VNLDVCVVAPTGRDGELIKRVLAQGRIEALICDGASLLISRAIGPPFDR